VRRALAASGLPADCLELEITESSVMLDPLHAQRVLQSLRELGVQLSIDDFGTGYSSLAYLKRLPLDRLKIDRSFIGGIPADSDDAAIVETIIVMTHKLGLRVIAEGVETLEQRLQLVRQGCDEMQGFLLAHPVPAGELPALLMEWPERDLGIGVRLHLESRPTYRSPATAWRDPRRCQTPPTSRRIASSVFGIRPWHSVSALKRATIPCAQVSKAPGQCASASSSAG
jgi:hypothetical protein